MRHFRIPHALVVFRSFEDQSDILPATGETTEEAIALRGRAERHRLQVECELEERKKIFDEWITILDKQSRGFQWKEENEEKMGEIYTLLEEIRFSISEVPSFLRDDDLEDADDALDDISEELGEADSMIREWEESWFQISAEEILGDDVVKFIEARGSKEEAQKCLKTVILKTGFFGPDRLASLLVMPELDTDKIILYFNVLAARRSENWRPFGEVVKQSPGIIDKWRREGLAKAREHYSYLEINWSRDRNDIIGDFLLSYDDDVLSDFVERKLNIPDLEAIPFLDPQEKDATVARMRAVRARGFNYEDIHTSELMELCKRGLSVTEISGRAALMHKYQMRLNELEFVETKFPDLIPDISRHILLFRDAAFVSKKFTRDEVNLILGMLVGTVDERKRRIIDSRYRNIEEFARHIEIYRERENARLPESEHDAEIFGLPRFSKEYERKERLRGQYVHTKDKLLAVEDLHYQCERQFQWTEEKDSPLLSDYYRHVHTAADGLDAVKERFDALERKNLTDDDKIAQNEAELAAWHGSLEQYEKSFRGCLEERKTVEDVVSLAHELRYRGFGNEDIYGIAKARKKPKQDFDYLLSITYNGVGVQDAIKLLYEDAPFATIAIILRTHDWREIGLYAKFRMIKRYQAEYEIRGLDLARRQWEELERETGVEEARREMVARLQYRFPPELMKKYLDGTIDLKYMVELLLLDTAKDMEFGAAIIAASESLRRGRIYSEDLPYIVKIAGNVDQAVNIFEAMSEEGKERILEFRALKKLEADQVNTCIELALELTIPLVEASNIVAIYPKDAGNPADVIQELHRQCRDNQLFSAYEMCELYVANEETASNIMRICGMLQIHDKEDAVWIATHLWDQREKIAQKWSRLSSLNFAQDQITPEMIEVIVSLEEEKVDLSDIMAYLKCDKKKLNDFCTRFVFRQNRRSGTRRIEGLVTINGIRRDFEDGSISTHDVNLLSFIAEWTDKFSKESVQSFLQDPALPYAKKIFEVSKASPFNALRMGRSFYLDGFPLANITSESSLQKFNHLRALKESVAPIHLWRGRSVVAVAHNEIWDGADVPDELRGKQRFLDPTMIEDMNRKVGETGSVTLLRTSASPTPEEIDAMIKKIRQEIIEKPDPLTFVFAGHGSPRELHLHGGEWLGQSPKPRSGPDLEKHISPEFMAEALIERRSRIGNEAFRNDILIFGSCFNHNFIRSILDILRKNGGTTPIIIGEAEYGQFGFTANERSENFEYNVLGLGEPDTFDPDMRHVFDRESEHRSSDVSVYIPDEAGKPQQVAEKTPDTHKAQSQRKT